MRTIGSELADGDTLPAVTAHGEGLKQSAGQQQLSGTAHLVDLQICVGHHAAIDNLHSVGTVPQPFIMW